MEINEFYLFKNFCVNYVSIYSEIIYILDSFHLFWVNWKFSLKHLPWYLGLRLFFEMCMNIRGFDKRRKNN